MRDDNIDDLTPDAPRGGRARLNVAAWFAGRNQDVREQAVEPALQEVEQGRLGAEAAWRRAVAVAEQKAS